MHRRELLRDWDNDDRGRRGPPRGWKEGGPEPDDHHRFRDVRERSFRHPIDHPMDNRRGSPREVCLNTFAIDIL